MKDNLSTTLQKTAFWMFVTGIILSIFNIFSWGIALLYLFEGDENIIRLLFGIICLIISTLTGYTAMVTASKIKAYKIARNATTLKEIFKYETRFWTYLISMILIAIILMLLIIFIRI